MRSSRLPLAACPFGGAWHQFGEGAALKTGLNYALVKCRNLRGVVTADGDGQHHPDDIVHVAESLAPEGNALVLGVRGFSGRVPLRSRLGNDITRGLMHALVGQKLADTQTGLRGIPNRLIPHLLRERPRAMSSS